MKLFTPIRKVTCGLVLVTVCLIMAGELLGLIPNEARGMLEGRKKFCESIAVQFSLAVGQRNFELLQSTLNALVERETEILSAAVRTEAGEVLLHAGDHGRHWAKVALNRSTATHVQVPIFQAEREWGTVEVAFADLPVINTPFNFGYPLIPFALFVSTVGFFAYLFFIKRTMAELDPQSVVPERVKSAFDALAEGLVIVDEKERIILANASFADKVQKPAEELIGRPLSKIKWHEQTEELPWAKSLSERKRYTGTSIKLQNTHGGVRTFAVNTTPIIDAKDRLRGVLATFDDLTDLERKQAELRQTVGQLQKSREELQEKAVELEFLATRDPLTGCLNRRAFFDKADVLFTQAREKSRPLACIMTDIDHFKVINDNHGHATGDKVIQLVANELRANARPDDLVARYGGEEFCLMLPNIELDAAVSIGERLRSGIKESAQANFPEESLRVTASFGVALISEAVDTPADLINLADKALYVAKENGRNRVISWRGGDTADLSAEALPLAEDNAVEAAALHHVEGPDAGEIESGGVTELKVRIAELEGRLESKEVDGGEHGQDVVTGLPNRLLLMDRIKQALTRGQRYDRIAAIIVLDIDLFRRINDALGFVIGDKVLRKAADRLLDVVRDTDTVSLLGTKAAMPTVSRTGADEFAILLTDLTDPSSATWIVKRILDTISAPLNIDGNEIFISCSAGISLFPHDAEDADDLLQHANAARFSAKSRFGRNNYAFFSADLNQVSYKHLRLEGQLHSALEQDEFSLHYQPKVNLRTGKITSMEALLRWENPKVGSVSPGDFIPIAERTGLITQIGQWALKTATEHARRWVDCGYTDVGIAVNLSPVQFREADLYEQIGTVLDETGLDPRLLEVEVTETVVMENFKEATTTLNKLAQAGVQIAIDDFGTGYSSLAYLKHLPVNTLKIDRSFLSDSVPDAQDKLIITAVIAMAHSMRLRVVAEGVETEVQRAFLDKLDCDEMQGYLVSKPVPAAESMALLKRYNSLQACVIPARKIA